MWFDFKTNAPTFLIVVAVCVGLTRAVAGLGVFAHLRAAVRHTRGAADDVDSGISA
jgi:hypothetical protein